ncbi:hypothetical protein JCGZ_05077 [Jatropha curcas]|uniref:Uncharacterized protein n=1 Tax=Jatropha curcas TaxID=180498 RepID=A0A067KTF5_JATCU|nr:hypothetical protein JCGZ_05077 [Jatropha curcas]
MDAKEGCKKVSQELARESLIGISYSLPEKIKNSDAVTEILTGEDRPMENGNGADKYRSELISISYSQSPDTAISPGALEKHDD